MDTSRTGTRRLLFCGALAGPLFTLLWLIEGATRADYQSLRNPISSLALGSLGWTQTTNFLLTGSLLLAGAVGVWHVLKSRGCSTWGAWLTGVIAFGLLGAGLFACDPIGGYPPGTPAKHVVYGSTHAALHDFFSAFVFLGAPIACFVMARCFARWRRGAWVLYSVATGIAVLVLFVLTSIGFAQTPGWAEYGGLLQRTTLTIFWAWMTLLTLKLRES